MGVTGTVTGGNPHAFEVANEKKVNRPRRASRDRRQAEKIYSLSRLVIEGRHSREKRQGRARIASRLTAVMGSLVDPITGGYITAKSWGLN